MTAGKAIIEVENVTCRFGPVTAVEDVTLAIEEGTIFGLVGSDGAGKSTLLRTMATMFPRMDLLNSRAFLERAADITHWGAR